MKPPMLCGDRMQPAGDGLFFFLP